MKKLLILGGSGQIGSYVTTHAGQYGFEPGSMSSSECDLTSLNSVRDTLRQVNPDVIINCAAYTEVDQAENQLERVRAVNVTGMENLAKAVPQDIPIIHVSTDYVFDGKSNVQYTESDTPKPINTYGQTKLAGETVLAHHFSHYVILRTSWVYSPAHKNFVTTMLRLAHEQDIVKIVADQYGSPTHAEDIAYTLLNIARTISNESMNSSHFGVFHYTGKGVTTWYEFADVIFDELKKLTGAVVNYEAITSGEFNTLAKRPKYSVLNNSKIEEVYGSSPVDWEQRVRSTVRDSLKTKA